MSAWMLQLDGGPGVFRQRPEVIGQWSVPTVDSLPFSSAELLLLQ